MAISLGGLAKDPMTQPLPPLREELDLMRGVPDRTGFPNWMIFDPARNRYFRIGWKYFQILQNWMLGTPTAIMNAVDEVKLDKKDFLSILGFLKNNNLLRCDVEGNHDNFLKQYKKAKRHPLKWLVHSYLFFRIPLVHPDPFLVRTARFVRFMFIPWLHYLVLAVGSVGLLKTVEHWEEFFTTFMHFFTLKGAFFLGVTIFFIKIIHELAHGYCLKRYGCKVPTMGIAFIVMWPVLYTDATDAWRLRSRRQRLIIGSAGMLVEIELALLCLLAWSILPDGIGKSLAFYIATASLLTTMAINLSPFLRFDGYYLMSDYFGIDNLHTRSFAFGKWKIKELLFGFNLPKPERFPPAMELNLIIFAWAICVYRFFLFLGIAILVYNLFFKTLGIILFIIEIVWFIALPMYREVVQWWHLRQLMTFNYETRRTIVIFATTLFFAVVPWNSKTSMPAIYTSDTYNLVFPSNPGQLVENNADWGKEFKKGDIMFKFSSSYLENNIQKAEIRIKIWNQLAQRIAASQRDLLESPLVLKNLAKEKSVLRGMKEQRELLTVRAPVDGKVVYYNDTLTQGAWLNQTVPLLALNDVKNGRLTAVLDERSYARLKVGAEGRFYPDNPQYGPFDVYVEEIDSTHMQVLSDPYFGSPFGGKVAAILDQNKNLIPQDAVYKVYLRPLGGEVEVPQKVMVGTAKIRGKRRSFIRWLYDSSASILIKESGF